MSNHFYHVYIVVAGLVLLWAACRPVFITTVPSRPCFMTPATRQDSLHWFCNLEAVQRSTPWRGVPLHIVICHILLVEIISLKLFLVNQNIFIFSCAISRNSGTTCFLTMVPVRFVVRCLAYLGGCLWTLTNFFSISKISTNFNSPPPIGR